MPQLEYRRTPVEKEGVYIMDTMGADLRGLLAELHEWSQEHDVRQEWHDDRLRNLEPETAALLAILVRSGGRRRLLEIGIRKLITLLPEARERILTGSGPRWGGSLLTLLDLAAIYAGLTVLASIAIVVLRRGERGPILT
jgi:hypothetical protein